MSFWIGFASMVYGAGSFGTFFYPKHKKILGQILVFLLVIFSGFRYRIGWDYDGYVILFNTVEIGDKYIEQSFILLIEFFRWIGLDYQSVFLFYSFFTLIFTYIGGKYYVKSLLLFMCLYTLFPFAYFHSMSVIRQSLAIAIILFGSKYICMHKIKKYIFFVLLATFIHSSAIAMLPVYFLGRIKFKLQWHIIFILISVLFSMVDILNPLIVKVLELIGLTKYAVYIILETTSAPLSLGNILFYILTYILIVFLLFDYRLINRDEKMTLVLNMCTMMNMVTFLFTFSHALMRVRDFFSIFLIVALVCIFESMRNIPKKFLFYQVVMLLSVSYFLVYLEHTANNPTGIISNSISANNIDYQFNFELIK